MWNCTNNGIPERDIRSEYMRTLEEAVLQAEDFDIRSGAVHEALDYLQNLSVQSWGFTLYREGLESCDINAIREGIELIKKHLGEDKN